MFVEGGKSNKWVYTLLLVVLVVLLGVFVFKAVEPDISNLMAYIKPENVWGNNFIIDNNL